MSVANPEAGPRATPRAGIDALPPTTLAAIAGVGLVVLLAYTANFLFLSERWEDPANSHGYLVLPIALGVAWLRRDRLDLGRLRPRFALGLGLLVACLALRHVLFGRNDVLLESTTLIGVVASTLLAFGGWHLLRWAAPALVLLAFLYPMPYAVDQLVTYPLQRVATVGSVFLLQACQLPAVAEGNVILIGVHKLEVAQACSGLSMLQTFAFLIVATVVAFEMPWYTRAILLLSIVPIALISNILRIAVTAWCYQNQSLEALQGFIGLFGYDEVSHFTHDAAGLFMMPVAMALVALELAVISWVVVPERDAPAARRA